MIPLTKSVLRLSDSSAEITRSLEISNHQAQLLHHTQRQSSISAVQLVGEINQLTATTHAELKKINSSTALIQQALLLQSQGFDRWWDSGLTSIVKFVLRGMPHHRSSSHLIRRVLRCQPIRPWSTISIMFPCSASYPVFCAVFTIFFGRRFLP